MIQVAHFKNLCNVIEVSVFTIKNLRTLTTEVFNVVNNICPPIMKAFFDFRENRYNIRKFHEMRQIKVRTVRYVLETALYRTPQLWSLVPTDLKALPNVNLFKSKITQMRNLTFRFNLWVSWIMKKIRSYYIDLCFKIFR